MNSVVAFFAGLVLPFLLAGLLSWGSVLVSNRDTPSPRGAGSAVLITLLLAVILAVTLWNRLQPASYGLLAAIALATAVAAVYAFNASRSD